MPATDLRYARHTLPESARQAILALDIKGWSVGWAVFRADGNMAFGALRVPDHHGGKPLPPPYRIVSLFRHLVAVASQADVGAIAVNARDHHGPAWTLAPILAAVLRCRFGEVRDWLDRIGLQSDRELRSWATVLVGKPVGDDLVATALGLGYAMIRGTRVEMAHVTDLEGLHESQG